MEVFIHEFHVLIIIIFIIWLSKSINGKLKEHRLSQSTQTNVLRTNKKLFIIKKSFKKQNGRTLAVTVQNGVTSDSKILLLFVETGDEIKEEYY